MDLASLRDFRFCSRRQQLSARSHTRSGSSSRHAGTSRHSDIFISLVGPVYLLQLETRNGTEPELFGKRPRPLASFPVSPEPGNEASEVK